MPTTFGRDVARQRVEVKRWMAWCADEFGEEPKAMKEGGKADRDEDTDYLVLGRRVQLKTDFRASDTQRFFMEEYDGHKDGWYKHIKGDVVYHLLRPAARMVYVVYGQKLIDTRDEFRKKYKRYNGMADVSGSIPWGIAVDMEEFSLIGKRYLMPLDRGESRCPQCDEVLVTPVGPGDAALFIAGEFPGIEEIASGIPFKGATGDILKAEIFRLNVFKYKDCRVGNLWLHKKTKTCDIGWHKEHFLKELRGHKIALLMGSEFGKGMLYEGSVTDKTGLTVVIDGVMCVIAPQPASIVKPGGSVGEFRFALKTLAKLLVGTEDDDAE